MLDSDELASIQKEELGVVEDVLASHKNPKELLLPCIRNQGENAVLPPVTLSI